MKKVLCLLAAFILSPSIAQAHVQWFVAPEEMKNAALPFDSISILLTVAVFVCVVIAIALTRYSRFFWLTDKLICGAPGISRKIYMSYFMIMINVFFITLLLQGGFLAPNLILPENLLMLGVVLQVAVVVCSSFSVALSGFVLLLTAAFMAYIFASLSLNYVFEFISIAIFMILNGHILNVADRWTGFNSDGWLWRLSITILRVGIGLQLVALALTEKLINPGMGLVFVETYPVFNFFSILGMDRISDLHFVYFIGISELTLGAMLALGVANRIVMLALAASFTTTAVILGLDEVLGHLPIFAAAVILLLECVNKSRRQNP
ncbi:MAG: hypothetical protein LBQ52_10630 [Helicobacteraceae bacterium]|jgi:hypothetical protein|nr:hypothetical protein [Helicobacteraceae bacterium]